MLFSMRFCHCYSGPVVAGAVLSSTAGDLVSHNSSIAAGSHTIDKPTYTHVAALQELVLVLVDNSSIDTSLSSNTNQRHLLSAPAILLNNSKFVAEGLATHTPGVHPHQQSGVRVPFNTTHRNTSRGAAVVFRPISTSSQNATGGSSNESSSDESSDDSMSTLDLDPPFRPLVDRYLALFPPGPDTGFLMMSSSRWGDVVVVDTTACGQLNSVR